MNAPFHSTIAFAARLVIVHDDQHGLRRRTYGTALRSIPEEELRRGGRARGNFGELRVLTCPTDAGHPVGHNIQ
ncbi:hypothetical protein IPZ58_34725 [Streptomyces roseoverticillatus]|uniref:hypothetical protein n=1 Tax=Streptomyces roseoverticillatus TaxID=66429 RepID=UPI001F2BC5A4|nr:hypothetical protein [Streptomyces roseoverticillatus]MCF3106684.1 hypothetical protein [Streptomyces roseoverticillatus]